MFIKKSHECWRMFDVSRVRVALAAGKLWEKNRIVFRKQPGFSSITSKSATMRLITEVYIKSDTEKKAEKEKVGTKRFRINKFVALFQHSHFYSQLFGYFSRINWASDWTQYYCRISLGHSQKRIELLSQIPYSMPLSWFTNNWTSYTVIQCLSWYQSPRSFILIHQCDELHATMTQRRPWLFLCVRHFSSVFIPVFGWRPSYSAELYLPLGCYVVIYKYEECFPYYIITGFLSQNFPLFYWLNPFPASALPIIL